MIKEWIEKYKPQNEEDILSALREIMQEITLAALSRTDFFEKAAFYGGTALRIFYGLDRYSEDLDFSLLQPNTNFSIEPYFESIFYVGTLQDCASFYSLNFKLNNNYILSKCF